MAKIDCSVTANYAVETVRVCRMYSDCSDCPFGADDAVCPREVFEYDRERAKQVIAALQKWSDEHPVKTRLDDLLEKYPKAMLTDGMPYFYLPEGFYERINNWDEYSSIVISDSVTHWMPMPEPPKPH